MKRIQLLGLAILSGFFLFIAWPVSPFTLLICLAWLPVLRIGDLVTKRAAFFGYTFFAVLIWNTGATWWIWNSTDIGTIAAILANSLLMCLPWWAYHVFKTKYGKRIGYASLLMCWMCFEYVHLNWQLSWPWLTLGNVFASHPQWVQWYELTGVGGGTLVILVMNLALYELFMNLKNKSQKKYLLKLSCILLVPPLFSFVFFTSHYSESAALKPALNVVIVQPNIDPYAKFDPATMQDDINRLVNLSEQNIDSATALVVWPETAMSAKDWQDHVISNPHYTGVFSLMQKHPASTLLSGIETVKFYGKEKLTATANKTAQGDYYDDFNAAVRIHNNEPLQFYNKSKLVPGVESMPTFLSFLAPVFEKFGGTAGGYGKSDESAVFALPGGYAAAPIICYESIYGEYVASYVQKGANLLTIMTNDGWWGNTPGHQQHLQYARLRAIETRRWVVRSANTGISAVINADGNIVETKPWDLAAVIKYKVPALSGLTFYVRYGDYLYKLASILTILLIGWHLMILGKKKLSKT